MNERRKIWAHEEHRFPNAHRDELTMGARGARFAREREEALARYGNGGDTTGCLWLLLLPFLPLVLFAGVGAVVAGTLLFVVGRWVPPAERPDWWLCWGRSAWVITAVLVVTLGLALGIEFLLAPDGFWVAKVRMMEPSLDYLANHSELVAALGVTSADFEPAVSSASTQQKWLAHALILAPSWLLGILMIRGPLELEDSGLPGWILAAVLVPLVVVLGFWSSDAFWGWIVRVAT